ncbi:GspH/FimT family protein [Gilvimarinus agarilyticus]|uniref:GspH/FimT family protein n=1 Tax=Gilvimarinus sp. 2_MG-2023 TaxID=3062666 RepID=UPI001C083D92|nr:GspH/FimT family protein [Gilvimarinus sp. 2_MG-2023]MBU2885212.1 GspH/FimT family protein [Gilvimarinus agarilyticus]MDO6570109.1 GspH/FimT family protein [Gilvimarinus sp. 2_MG-2023]
MNHNGFTLIEAIITLLILAILAVLATPIFQRLIQDLRVETTMWSLFEATQITRSYAIKANKRASMSANPTWQQGWQIFYDNNHNGEPDNDETILLSMSDIPEGITIEGNQPVADYISYLGSGESRWATGKRGGGFQAGTLTICPEADGEGYKLILARGGRVRKEKLEPEEC